MVVIKKEEKIDFIQGKKYVFKLLKYYLNFRLKERTHERVSCIIEIGIQSCPQINYVIYYDVLTLFTKQNGKIKIYPSVYLNKLINDRFVIKELIKKIEDNLN